MTAPREGKCRYCGNVLLGDRREEDCVSKPLSAEERAREILRWIRETTNMEFSSKVEEYLTAQLVAYYEEHDKYDARELAAGLRRSEAEGYRRGIEEAAEICLKYHEEIDGTDCMCDEGIAAVQLAKQISGLDKGAKE
jgi:hypothetical protein